MPLDDYRKQADGGPVRRVSPDTPPEPAANEGRQEHWLDSESFWDTAGERPLPEFDWGDD